MSRPLRGTTGITALAVALAAALALGWTAWQWLGTEPPAPGVKLAAAPTSPPTSAPTSAPAVAPAGIGQGAPQAPEPAASTASAPAAAPSAPAAPRDERFKGIGSEGFGPHVQRALDSGDPRQALDAARWIAGCRPDMDVESMINGSHPKYRLVLPAHQQAEVITNERQNQRFCQTLTPDLMAQHRALALRALEAKVPGSGLAYYQSLDLEKRSPDELERALQGLRADAEHGQEMAVPLLAVVKLGQSRVEQLAYTKLMDLLMLKNILPPASGLGMPPPPAGAVHGARASGCRRTAQALVAALRAARLSAARRAPRLYLGPPSHRGRSRSVSPAGACARPARRGPARPRHQPRPGGHARPCSG